MDGLNEMLESLPEWAHDIELVDGGGKRGMCKSHFSIWERRCLGLFVWSQTIIVSQVETKRRSTNSLARNSTDDPQYLFNAQDVKVFCLGVVV